MSLFEVVAARYFGFVNFLACRAGVFILMYHRINDDLPPSHLIVSVKKFKEQMAYLKQCCDVIGIDRLPGFYKDKKGMAQSRRPQVVITIDDGYRDNYLNAFPVLKEFNLPATIFVSTGFIGTNKKMRRYDDLPAPDMLSWQEIQEMRNSGNITFGPHTVNHPHLLQLNRAQQKEEIEKSMNGLFAKVPDPLCKKIFSYTYGEYDSELLNVLKELGIDLAVTVGGGINNYDSDPRELKRLGVDGRDNLVGFMSKFVFGKSAAY